MNKTKIQNQINDLEKKLAELKEELNKPENRVFKPKNGDTYYHISDDGFAYCSVWKFTSKDCWRYSIGNCFETIDEAKFEIERVKVITELKRFAKEHNDPIDWDKSNQTKYSFFNYRRNDYINIGFAYQVKRNDIYFSSKELAEQAIKEIGEDRIKKYYLGME